MKCANEMHRRLILGIHDIVMLRMRELRNSEYEKGWDDAMCRAENLVNTVFAASHDQSPSEERLDAVLIQQEGRQGKMIEPVNHPSHYTTGRIDAIDFLEDLRFPYHLGNAVKYIIRAVKKGPKKRRGSGESCMVPEPLYRFFGEGRCIHMNIDIPGQGKVLAHYGHDAQSMVHMEECAELIQAVSKMRRVRQAFLDGQDVDDGEAYENLVEEMADVLICLEQLQEMYEIPDHAIQSMIEKKCLRQEERMNEHA